MAEHTGVRLDFANMVRPHCSGGLDPARLDVELQERFAVASAEVARRRDAGDLGFLDLPYADETIARVQRVADGFGQWFEDVVVLGIGGSSLGALALREALLGPGWNARDAEGRDHYPRLHVVDNPDPTTLARLLGRLDPARVLFNVVSKSGSTAETMAQYLVARSWVEKALGEDQARGHFLFTTDPARGALRRLAEAEDIPTLPVPENVGGRFSVLSPVGLLPAAVCGVDIRALLSGAAAMEARCRAGSLAENPAGVLAVLLHEADTAGRMGIHVLMPYADRLRAVALWFQQLWAESLGKERGEGGHVGPTPLAAVGASDQHSLMQLFMEGPRDKVVVFVGVEERGEDLPIPDLHPGVPSLSYLGDHTLGELLDAERRASAEALRRRGRPNATLILPSVQAGSVGELLMLLQAATVLAGALYGVDPLDQPGVELGKELTYGLLGRDGWDAPSLDAGDPQWIV